MKEKKNCRYCGKEFMPRFTCMPSPTRTHLAVSNGKDCVYCGDEFRANFSCTVSPDKKHHLDK